MCWHSDVARGVTSGFCPAGRASAVGVIDTGQGTDAHLKWLRAETPFVCHISIGLCHSSSNCCRNLGVKSKEKAFFGCLLGALNRGNGIPGRRTEKNSMIGCLESLLKQSKLSCCMILCGTWGHLESLSQHLLCATSTLQGWGRATLRSTGSRTQATAPSPALPWWDQGNIDFSKSKKYLSLTGNKI